MNGDKKIEKLNIRISDAEKDLLQIAADKSGESNLSSWARSVLMQKANVLEPAIKKVDLAIAVTGSSVDFLVDTDENALFSLPPYAAYARTARKGAVLVAAGVEAIELQRKKPQTIRGQNVIEEGMIVDEEGFKGLLTCGYNQLRDHYDFSESNVLIAARVLPATKNALKELVRSIIPAKNHYLIEYSMACAIGINLDVQNPELTAQPLLCIEDDWLELATIYAGDTNGRKTCAMGKKQIIEELQNEDFQTSPTIIRIGDELKKHLDQIKELGIFDDSREVIVTGIDETIGSRFKKALEDASGISITLRNMPHCGLLGARKVLPQLKGLSL